jgi:hypothetical protein
LLLFGPGKTAGDSGDFADKWQHAAKPSRIPGITAYFLFAFFIAAPYIVCYIDYATIVFFRHKFRVNYGNKKPNKKESLPP